MTSKIVFTHEEPTDLEEDGFNVIETYRFENTDVPNAATIEHTSRLSGSEELDRLNEQASFELLSAYDDMQFTVDIAPSQNDALRAPVDIGEVRQLHSVGPHTGGEGAGVSVAITDSGIDASHPIFEEHDTTIEFVDLTGQGAIDPVDEVGHGTACAGQVARLAPDADITMLRIFGESGSTGFRSILRAYEYLHKHVREFDLVNMSWGTKRRVPELDQLHDQLVSKGLRDVTSAGNTGSTSGSPSTASKAFSVGASTAHGTVANFSSYNPEYANPEVTAVGKQIKLARATGTSMGTVLGEHYIQASGTSFSAPEVCGMAARLLSADSTASLTPQGVETAFVEGADPIEGTERDGAGLVDCAETVQRFDAEPQPPQQPDKPSTPDKPTKPKKPDSPDKPNTPDKPDKDNPDKDDSQKSAFLLFLQWLMQIGIVRFLKYLWKRRR